MSYALLSYLINASNNSASPKPAGSVANRLETYQLSRIAINKYSNYDVWISTFYQVFFALVLEVLLLVLPLRSALVTLRE